MMRKKITKYCIFLGLSLLCLPFTVSMMVHGHPIDSTAMFGIWLIFTSLVEYLLYEEKQNKER